MSNLFYNLNIATRLLRLLLLLQFVLFYHFFEQRMIPSRLRLGIFSTTESIFHPCASTSAVHWSSVRSCPPNKDMSMSTCF
mmetsp:Transcript_14564/g.42679  ORF Transcript_14564/g.42679 Transcript_14564/m.42679 type:complete len:81 (+) Transcript_14564:110-352(+)